MSDVPAGSSHGSDADPDRARIPTPVLSQRGVAPGAQLPQMTPTIPSQIGHYQILRVLGEGGMGTVYEAQQAQPNRKVALKVIRSGLLSTQLLRRFEHESQVLGRLQHPGIAQVYEAGTVQDSLGQPVPFFAMEFIRGTTLTQYVNERKLGTRDRLELVARICDAVDHAHQKGVIHRDLKPANILVDESGQPKILDFGVARATDSDVQQTTMQTDVGQIIGTVPYMSPEQVSGDPSELDTRSDVYALGVIAYELLAGRLPYDISKRLIHDAIRVIREEEPTRLSSIDRSLRGDVETIVARALEKEKSRRYPSASALGGDIRHYLMHEPITARPASTWYQASKFAKRHPGLVGGVTAAFLLLIAGLIGTSYGLRRAIDARNAEASAKSAAQQSEAVAKAAEATAKVERDRAQSVTEFVVASLQSQDPSKLGQQDMTVAQAMTRAVQGLERGDLDAQPATKAVLLRTIALILDNNGRSAEAEAPAEQALQIERELHIGDHADVAKCLANIASVRQSLGRAAEAEPLCVQALEMYQRLFRGDNAEVAAALNNLASVRDSLGRVAETESLYVQALEMKQRLFKGDHPSVANALSNVATARMWLGRTSEAEPLYLQALQMNQRLFKGDHPRVASALNNLADARKALGRDAEAELLFVQALEMKQRLYKGDHPSVAQGLVYLAIARQSLGRGAEAEALFAQALDMYQRLYKGDHPDVAGTLDSLATAIEASGRATEAEPIFVQSVEMWRRLEPDGHPYEASAMANLAECLAALDRLPEALQHAQQAVAMAARVVPEGHWIRADCERVLAEITAKMETKTNESGLAAPNPSGEDKPR